MEETPEIFQKAIGLVTPWYIKEVKFTAEEKRLDIYVDFIKGTRFAYTEKTESGGKVAGEFPVYDTTEKIWRHLNFFQHECYLHCRVARIKLADGKTRTISPPFAGQSNGFTLLFEALLLQLCKGMTIAEVGRLTNESAHKLWEMLDRYIQAGRDLSNYTAVKKIGLDETAIKRGHNYITLFVDMEKRAVLYVTAGKGNETVKQFVTDFEKHHGEADNITQASSDLSPAFIKGITENFPNARITFDKFHVIKLINEAVDQVRREEAKTQPILKKSRYAVLKNEENLTETQKEKREEITLSKLNLKTIRAMHMRENFQAVYTAETKEDFTRLLQKWYYWTSHSRLPAMMHVAKTIKRHWDGIVSWYDTEINNAVLEGINSLVQAAKAKARGYRTVKNFANIVYLLKGNLNFSAVNLYYPLNSS
jgi:transposase